MSVIRVGLLGYGRVGRRVDELAADPAAPHRRIGIDVVVTSALVRSAPGRPVRTGVKLTTTAADVLAAADVVVEVLGGAEPARGLVTAALTRGLPVVTATKTLMAAHGDELRPLADACRAELRFEAAVVAGVPFAGSLGRRPWFADARRVAGIVNGTSHFVLTAVASGRTVANALDEAVTLGYAEPDARADLDGRDAAEKLAILLHLCGHPAAAVSELTRRRTDDVTPDDVGGAAAFGCVIKPIVWADLGPPSLRSWVGPALLDRRHRFAATGGVDNILELTSRRGQAVTFAGPGAGPDVTAATILDDVVEVARPGAPADDHHVPAGKAPVRYEEPICAWFVRVRLRTCDSVRDAAIDKALRVGVDRLECVGENVFIRTRVVDRATLTRHIDHIHVGRGEVLALPIIAD